MDIIKCLDWKMRELNSQSTGGEDSKRPHDETTNHTSTPTSPGNLFEESLKSDDCT